MFIIISAVQHIPFHKGRLSQKTAGNWILHLCVSLVERVIFICLAVGNVLEAEWFSRQPSLVMEKLLWLKG